jgi:lambda family phage portal protein
VSVFLKAMALVAPNAAMRRMRALAVIDAQKRYAGATLGRRGASFLGQGASANSAIGPHLALLRNRSREMARDHWAFGRILDVTVGHAIGAGISVIPDNGSTRVDRLAKEALEEWMASSDVTGELDFHGQMALALRSMLEGGESLFRFIDLPPSDSRRVKMALQLWEGDIIDSSVDGSIRSKKSRLGVELGEYGQRTGYWMLPDYPSEGDTVRIQPALIPRSEIVHLYKMTRPGQVRGVPVFAPVLMPARDLADLMDAVIVKAKIEACFSAFVTKTGEGPLDPLTETQPGQSGLRERVTDMAPGMIVDLDPGEDIKFGTPSNGGNFFEPSYNASLYAMAAGAGITFDQLTGDLRQANYSSLRAGKIEFRRLIEQLQWLTIIPKMYVRIMERFNDRAVLAGVLPARARDGYRWKYVTPANEPIDPKKDLEADILAVRSGRMSPQEFIAGYGRDWREVVDDFSTFLEEIDKKKLMFDIDPRKTSQSGIEQPSQYATDPAPTAQK